MLPRLEAEEQLAAARTTSLGSGTYPKEEAAKLLAVLDERASGGPSAKPKRPRKASPADLAAMGIGVAPQAAKNGLSRPGEKDVSGV